MLTQILLGMVLKTQLIRMSSAYCKCDAIGFEDPSLNPEKRSRFNALRNKYLSLPQLKESRKRKKSFLI